MFAKTLATISADTFEDLKALSLNEGSYTTQIAASRGDALLNRSGSTRTQTISIWYKMNATSTEGYLFTNGFPNYALAIDNNGSGSYQDFDFIYIDGTGSVETLEAVNAIPKDTNFHHIVFVFNGDSSNPSAADTDESGGINTGDVVTTNGRWILYVDGVEFSGTWKVRAGDSLLTTTLRANAEEYAVGGRLSGPAHLAVNTAAGFAFDGQIADIAIWPNDILSSTDILKLYNGGQGPLNIKEEISTSAAVWWRMGDGDGDSYPLIRNQMNRFDGPVVRDSGMGDADDDITYSGSDWTNSGDTTYTNTNGATLTIGSNILEDGKTYLIQLDIDNTALNMVNKLFAGTTKILEAKTFQDPVDSDVEPDALGGTNSFISVIYNNDQGADKNLIYEFDAGTGYSAIRDCKITEIEEGALLVMVSGHDDFSGFQDGTTELNPTGNFVNK